MNKSTIIFILNIYNNEIITYIIFGTKWKQIK